jgi:hypothetical protein
MRHSGIRLAGRFQTALVQRSNRQGKLQHSEDRKRRCQINPMRRSKNRAPDREQVVRLLRAT